jgi:hypothetical protein
MSTEELKCCPFCGAEGDRIILTEQEPHSHSPALKTLIPGIPDHPGSWTIECCGCNIGMIEDTREAVVAAWNRRAANSNSAEFDGIKSAAPAAGTEKDADRLDWLERTNQTFCGNYSDTGFRAIGSSIWHGTLREAIDGAMLEEAAIAAKEPPCGP